MAVQDTSTVQIIQQHMNDATGTVYWFSNNDQWENLLLARNAFVRWRIEQMGFTIHEFKTLFKPLRRSYIRRLETAFSAEFFQYSRDQGWMQAAVTESDSWMRIPGMREWHVKSALHALEYSAEIRRAVQTAPDAEESAAPGV